MSLSAEFKIPRDGRVIVTDGVKTYEFSYDKGDVKISKKKRARVLVMSRGDIVGARAGDQQVHTITMSCHYKEFTNSQGTSDANNATPMDVIDGTGNWSDAANPAGAGFDDSLQFRNLQFIATAQGDDPADSSVTATKCVGEWEFSESETDTIDITWEVLGDITPSGAS
jgi:hypothetical protein